MKIIPSALPLTFAHEFSEGWADVSFSQLGEDGFVGRYFERSGPGFYVDVGAFHPRRYSNTYLLRKYMGWSGINIDANPDIVALFKRECPDEINICAAVDEEERDVELVIYSGAAHSTIDERRKLINDSIPVRSRVQTRSRALGDILRDHIPAGKQIDFLSIDVEGRDLAALKSMDFSSWRPMLICVEDHDFVRAINSGIETEIFSLMRSLNYDFQSHYSVSTFYRAR